MWVNFGRSEDALAWCSYGWGSPADDCVWTEGRKSGLALPETFRDEPFILELEVQPWTQSPLVRGQILRVSTNGQRLGSYRVTERGVIRCRIDPAMLPPGEPIVVCLEQPCFVRSDLLGDSSDPAARAIALYSARLTRCRNSAAANSTSSLSVLQAFAAGAACDATEAGHGAIVFDAAALAAPIPGEGWHRAKDTNLWTARPVTSLMLPRPDGAGPYQLRIVLAPQISFLRPTQRIAIVLNGFVVGQFRIRTETCLVVALPPEAIGDSGVMELVLQTPDGVALDEFAGPADVGMLGFIVERIVVEPCGVTSRLIETLRDEELGGIEPLARSDRFLDPVLDDLPAAIEVELGTKLTDLLKQFESVGDNCNFGLVQRKAGVEVLQLLRFGNAPVQALLRAFADDFAALSTGGADLSVSQGEPPLREFYVNAPRYGIRWHTLRYPNSSTAEAIFEEHAIRLRYLRQKFYQGLRSQRKIYVIARATPDMVTFLAPRVADVSSHNDRLGYFIQSEPLRAAEVAPVLQYLNGFGRNTLLYIVPSCPGKPAGTVELLSPGLMRGYLDHLAVSDDTAIRDHAGWLRVLGNAWRLDRGPYASSRPNPAHAGSDAGPRRAEAAELLVSD